MKKQTSETHFDSGNPPLPGAAPPKPGNALRLALLMGVVVGITLWVHWPVLSAKAISFDDEEAIVHDHLVRHPGLNSVGRFFSEIRGSTAVRGYYLPLSLTSLMVDYNLGGRLDNPRPFHRTSLALHVGSTILLMLLCHQIFRQPWVAALVGLMFGVHPLTVEPVAWIIERMTVLAAFFAFAALNAYVRFAVKGRRRWYALALILFVLALLSKPTSTPLPLIMLLMNYWPLRRFSRQTLLEIVPFLALSVASVVLAVFSEGHTNPLAAPVSNDPGHLLLRLCWLTVFHPFKALVPLRLSSVYDLPEPLSLGNPVVLLAVVTTILLLAALALSARMTRAIWVGAAIFYVALVPTMGFVGITWMVGCDKYVYLPAIGPILVAAWLINGLWSHAKGISLGKQRAATICAALAGAGLLAMCTRGYLQRWKTTDTLLTHMLSLAPRSPSLHSRQGDLHMAVGQYDDAIREFTAAIEGYPGHAEAYYNRGLCFASLGRYASAQRDFTEAIRFRPNYTDAYNNRGNVFSAVGDYERALADYRKAIELEPDRDAAYVNRANVYASAGELDLALRDLAKAIEINSGSQEAYYCRGNVLAMMGDTERAIQDYSRVIKLTPDHVGAYNNRGNAWIAKQDFTRALHDFSRAIELQPNSAALYFNRGFVHDAMGDLNRAIADFTLATELDPRHAVAFNSRGNCYLIQKVYRRAIEDYDRAIAIQPNYANAYANRGKAFADSHDLQQAILNYTRAIDINPNHTIALVNRAEAYLQLQRYDRAWADIQECRRLGGTPPPALVEALTAATGRAE